MAESPPCVGCVMTTRLSSEGQEVKTHNVRNASHGRNELWSLKKVVVPEGRQSRDDASKSALL